MKNKFNFLLHFLLHTCCRLLKKNIHKIFVIYFTPKHTKWMSKNKWILRIQNIYFFVILDWPFWTIAFHWPLLWATQHSQFFSHAFQQRQKLQYLWQLYAGKVWHWPLIPNPSWIHFATMIDGKNGKLAVHLEIRQ